MADGFYRVRAQIIYEWVPAGAGSALMGQQQADQPGYGAAATFGPVGMAQTASDIVGEIVPGGSTPSGSNFQTALNNLAADEYTRLITAGDVPGFAGSGTLLGVVQGWATGNP
jgi:hypothetical protein